MRKALLIGINNYVDFPLRCCLNDVEALESSLSNVYDGSINFSIEKILDKSATRSNIKRNIKRLFEGNGEVALLYFSGHGKDDLKDGFIVTVDYEKDDYGIKMTDILEYANESKYRYKIIILDCCHSGFVGSPGLIGDKSYLSDGVVIMTASKKDESSIEINGHGVFTNLLLEGLNGGAADILGRVTPGSIYSYVDQALGPWQQRPLFKANVSSFINLKQCEPSIRLKELKDTLSLFIKEDSNYNLDPSYEKTNYVGSGYKICEPYATQEHIDIMTKLQKLNRFGLLKPLDCVDMYFAAMDSKSCCLTPLGKHYWKMMNERKL